MAKKLMKKQTGGMALYKKPTAFQSYLNTTKGAVPSDTIPRVGTDGNGHMLGSITAARPKNQKKLRKAFDEDYKDRIKYSKKTGGSVKKYQTGGITKNQTLYPAGAGLMQKGGAMSDIKTGKIVKPTKTLNYSGDFKKLDSAKIKRSQGDTTVVINKVPSMTKKDSVGVSPYIKTALVKNKKGGATKKMAKGGSTTFSKSPTNQANRGLMKKGGSMKGKC